MKKVILIWMSLFFTNMIYANHGFRPSWYPDYRDLNIGYIYSVDSKHLAYDDRYFLMSPTVKISTIKLRKALLSDLKVGQRVGFTSIKINNKKLVDHVYIIPENK